MSKTVKKLSLKDKVIMIHRSNPNLSAQLSRHLLAVQTCQHQLTLAEESLREFINRHNLNKD